MNKTNNTIQFLWKPSFTKLVSKTNLLIFEQHLTDCVAYGILKIFKTQLFPICYEQHIREQLQVLICSVLPMIMIHKFIPWALLKNIIAKIFRMMILTTISAALNLDQTNIYLYFARFWWIPSSSMVICYHQCRGVFSHSWVTKFQGWHP